VAWTLVNGLFISFGLARSTNEVGRRIYLKLGPRTQDPTNLPIYWFLMDYDYLLATATAADPIDGWIVGSLFGSVALYSGL